MKSSSICDGDIATSARRCSRSRALTRSPSIRTSSATFPTLAASSRTKTTWSGSFLLKKSLISRRHTSRTSIRAITTRLLLLGRTVRRIEARRGGSRLLALAPHDPARPRRLRRADARLAAHRARILRASGALGRRRAGLWRDSFLSPAAHHRQATRHQYRLLPGHRAGWRDWRAPTRSTGESSRASRLARAPTVTRSRFFLSRTIFERSSYSSSAIAPLLEHAGIDPAEYR